MKMLLVLFLMILANVAHSHSGDLSYINLNVSSEPDQTILSGMLKVPLVEMDKVLDLDINDDEIITWGEVSNQFDRIEDYLVANVSFGDGAECSMGVGGMDLETLSSGLYLVSLLDVICTHVDLNNFNMEMNYRVFFDENPLAKAMLIVQKEDQTLEYLLTAEQSSFNLESPTNKAVSIASYFAQGIWHIVIGLDHLLFLATLIVPIALRRSASSELSLNGIGRNTVEIIKVVTAFTVAHSVTLVLASLGLVNVPMGIVEWVIACSVVLGALLALSAKLDRWRWMLALGFGFIHGFGFASVLSDILQPSSNVLILSILSFNLGVEIGQLLLVIAIMPVLLFLQRYKAIQTYGVSTAMTVIALVGLIWVIDRGVGMNLV